MRTYRALALIAVMALLGVLVSMPAAHTAVDNHLSLVSVATPEVFPDANGSFSRAISDDGRFVVFASSQPNIVVGDEADPDGRYLYLRDLQSGTTTRLSHGPGGFLMSNAAISADGGYVTFASDEGDGQSALRLYNRSTNATTVISKPPAAEDNWYTVAISDDARYVFYTRTQHAGEDFETKLYRYVVQTGVTDRPISGRIGSLQNPDSGTIPSSSANGRYLTFVQSLAPAEVVSFYRLVRLDTRTGTKTVIGKSSQAEGIPRNAFGDPSMSNSGRYIAYTSRFPGRACTSTSTTPPVGRPSSSVTRPGAPAPRPTTARSSPRSVATGATSRSSPQPRTSWPASPPWTRSSSTTASLAPPRRS